MTTLAVVVLVLLFANGLFVAAEFALVGAPRAAVEHRAKSGDRRAARMLALLSSAARQDRYIATAQLGITLASLGLGMYGEHRLAEWLEPHFADLGGAVPAHAVASVAAVAALTYLHIFIGEMVPKAIALSHPERTSRTVFWPMRIAYMTLMPAVYVLNGLGAVGLRLLGVRRREAAGERGYTPEELQLIVREAEKSGALQTESGRVLRELLEFGDRSAGQAMVPRVRVIGIPLGATSDELRDFHLRHRHTRYPVFEGDLDHITGMLHVKDLLRHVISGEPLGPDDVRQMPVVPETTALDDVLTTMERTHAHMAIVIDEHGGTAGVVSLEDLFEEVVGEIDEGQPVTPSLRPQPDGSVRVAGTVRLDELGRHFDLDLEHDEVDSISGLVLAQLDRPPVVGDAVEYGRVRLEVLALEGRGVREARATLMPEVSHDTDD